MIHVTNDWFLKKLPNEDVYTDASYTNDISKDLFPFLVRLKSGDRGVEKYVTSSTGLKIPMYQPDPGDILQYDSELAMNRMGRNIDTYCSLHISKDYLNSTSIVERLRTNPDGDAYGYENLEYFRWRVFNETTGEFEYKPIKFKFFNPSTCAYDKTLILGAKVENQRYYYVNGRQTTRQYQSRYNLYWYNEDDTQELYPLWVNDSHINIMPDDNVRVTGDGLTGRPYLYFYSDIGFDPINEKWVGLLNLFCRGGGTALLRPFTADDVPRTPSASEYRYNGYAFWQLMGRNIYEGPYSSVQDSYSQALGTSSPLAYIYFRAFELESQPNIPIEQRTDPLTKIGCYGPNTRIVP